ncbi:hypothetical protein JOQ06_000636, partial [Pogonophryne albipinna]
MDIGSLPPPRASRMQGVGMAPRGAESRTAPRYEEVDRQYSTQPSGAELCAKSPRGPPLLKAISSQNECGSTIGLVAISIHLACLCVEPAGAAAGGEG